MVEGMLPPPSLVPPKTDPQVLPLTHQVPQLFLGLFVVLLFVGIAMLFDSSVPVVILAASIGCFFASALTATFGSS